MEPPIPTPIPSYAPLDSVDPSPLLTRSLAGHLLRSRRLLRSPPTPLRGAASRLLRRASSRRMMLREPSVRVRENAAEQLEVRQNDWSYSRPIIVLDILWNLAFLVVIGAVLMLSWEEKPDVPLRMWVIGYGLQCLLHVACVVDEYRNRVAGGHLNSSDISSGSASSDDGADYDGSHSLGGDDETSVAKSLESANTMLSFFWWIIGFYWVTTSGQNLSTDSPDLYWLSVTFLAFDAVFVIICITAACLIGIAICCCLPCIIAILYAMADREGATKEEIEQLPKYNFRRIGKFEKDEGESQESFGGTMMMTECDTDSPNEQLLSQDDAECCICLCCYEDGNELRQLPCDHHFHCACIDKWLYINATCPLCKFNILKAGSNSSSSEEV